MFKSSSGFATALVVVLWAAMALPAGGQTIVSGVENWTRTGNAAAFDPSTATGNVSSVSKSALTTRHPNDAIRLRIQANAVEDLQNPADRFELGLYSTQDFTLSEPGVIHLPLFLNGRILFFGEANKNFARGRVVGQLQLFTDDVTAGTFDQKKLEASFDQQYLAKDGQVESIVNKLILQSSNPGAPLPARKYQLKAALKIIGDADFNNPGAAAKDSEVDVVFDDLDKERAGLVGSFAALPANVDSFDSRAAIRAPSARSAHNLTGAGVTVGVIDGGVPYKGHSALPNARLETLVLAPENELLDEHATAVAGIIAGQDNGAGRAGVAPGAKIFAVSQMDLLTDSLALDTVIQKGARVVNKSTTSILDNPEYTDFTIAEKPEVTFVHAAGNDGKGNGANTISTGAQGFNIISVGAVNRDFTKTARLSSVNDTDSGPRKPDIVAPGEYVLAPSVLNADGSAGPKEFRRFFLGDGYNRRGGSVTGDISGTSFAAPAVAGAAALLNEYKDKHYAASTVAADHRVIKAVLLTGASVTVKHNDGTAWEQKGRTGELTKVKPLTVPESLDRELGAGLLHVKRSVDLYAAGEVRTAALNNARNLQIDGDGKSMFWDFERVGAREAGDNANGQRDGTVDYLMGEVAGKFLRTTLTWDRGVEKKMQGDIPFYEYKALDELQLNLWREGTDQANKPGFDPTQPLADDRIALTIGNLDNVKLFNLMVPDVAGKYYLQVRNLSMMATDYGIAVIVPLPGSAALLLMAAALGAASRKGLRRNSPGM